MFAERLRDLLDQPEPGVKLIMPGEFYVSRKPVEICTLLGSCVSACIWDKALHIGGMNHFMLPDEPTHASNLGDQTKPLRYGLFAMERVINDLIVLGARRENLVAKVFGGANMTGVITQQNVGQRNSEFVIDFLKRDRIKLLASDLNGSHSRRIRFNTGTGAVRVEKVAKADLSVAAQEQKYSRQLKEQPVTGDITFF